MRRAPSKKTKTPKAPADKSYVPNSVKPKKPAMAINKQYSVNKKTGTKTLIKGIPLKRK